MEFVLSKDTMSQFVVRTLRFSVVISIPPLLHFCGPCSSVGIATDYGVDGPGSNPGGDEIFRPSRPALWPTQPAVKRVLRLSRG